MLEKLLGRFRTKSAAPVGGETPPESLSFPLVYVCADIHGELDRYRRLL